MNFLTSEETSQLELVRANAQREGWLDSSVVLAAKHAAGGTWILVTATHGSGVVEKKYERDSRWPFRLLRDLAWGAYELTRPRTQPVAETTPVSG